MMVLDVVAILLALRVFCAEIGQSIDASNAVKLAKRILTEDQSLEVKRDWARKLATITRVAFKGCAGIKKIKTQSVVFAVAPETASTSLFLAMTMRNTRTYNELMPLAMLLTMNVEAAALSLGSRSRVPLRDAMRLSYTVLDTTKDRHCRCEAASALGVAICRALAPGSNSWDSKTDAFLFLGPEHLTVQFQIPQPKIEMGKDEDVNMMCQVDKLDNAAEMSSSSAVAAVNHVITTSHVIFAAPYRVKAPTAPAIVILIRLLPKTELHIGNVFSTLTEMLTPSLREKSELRTVKRHAFAVSPSTK